MYRSLVLGVAGATVLALPAAQADPTIECGVDHGSQVEIGACLQDVEKTVNVALAAVLEMAAEASRSLDEVTGRADMAPALESGQAAWEAYRAAHCAYVGASFGGGSGTGAGVLACRITLTRARIDALLASMP